MSIIVSPLLTSCALFSNPFLHSQARVESYQAEMKKSHRDMERQYQLIMAERQRQQHLLLEQQQQQHHINMTGQHTHGGGDYANTLLFQQQHQQQQYLAAAAASNFALLPIMLQHAGQQIHAQQQAAAVAVAMANQNQNSDLQQQRQQHESHANNQPLTHLDPHATINPSTTDASQSLSQTNQQSHHPDVSNPSPPSSLDDHSSTMNTNSMNAQHSRPIDMMDTSHNLLSHNPTSTNPPDSFASRNDHSALLPSINAPFHPIMPTSTSTHQVFLPPDLGAEIPNYDQLVEPLQVLQSVDRQTPARAFSVVSCRSPLIICINSPSSLSFFSFLVPIAQS